jgi:acid phosphatase
MKTLFFVLALGGFLWGQVPRSNHVWIIAEENRSYETVIGSSSMPYFNSLASKYGLTFQYYAPQHSSLPALMWLVAGQPITLNNNTTSCFSADNIVRHLLANGLTWKSYQEDLPYAGFQGLSWQNYVRRHNPLIDFTDSCTASQKFNSVPLSQLALDMANNTTPNYAWITPNLQHDAHDGTLAQADAWLAQNVPAILARPEFKPGGDGLLFIAWDEGDVPGDDRCSSRLKSGCGGRVATLVVGPQVKRGYKSGILYSHQNLLRTVCDALGMTSCPGAATYARPMLDFFNTVTITTPFRNSNVASPVHIKAITSNSVPVSAVQIYVDNVLRSQSHTGQIDTYVPMSLGKHSLLVQSWDTAGDIHKSSISVTVQSEAVVVDLPAPGATVGSPVAIAASAGGVTPVNTMQVYADNTLRYQVSGNKVNTSLALANGKHNLVMQAWDRSGGTTKTAVSVTVAKPSVTFLSPAPGSAIYPPFPVTASAQDPTPIKTIQLYVDNLLTYETSGTGMQRSLSLPVGQHNLVAQAWNVVGQAYKTGININVLPVPVSISAPGPNSTVNSPVAIRASVPSSSAVHVMQVYVDNVLKYQVSGKVVTTSLPMSPGKHYFVVKAWDTAGGTWMNGASITVP